MKQSVAIRFIVALYGMFFSGMLLFSVSDSMRMFVYAFFLFFMMLTLVTGLANIFEVVKIGKGKIYRENVCVQMGKIGALCKAVTIPYSAVIWCIWLQYGSLVIARAQQAWVVGLLSIAVTYMPNMVAIGYFIAATYLRKGVGNRKRVLWHTFFQLIPIVDFVDILYLYHCQKQQKSGYPI